MAREVGEAKAWLRTTSKSLRTTRRCLRFANIGSSVDPGYPGPWVAPGRLLVTDRWTTARFVGRCHAQLQGIVALHTTTRTNLE